MPRVLTMEVLSYDVTFETSELDRLKSIDTCNDSGYD